MGYGFIASLVVVTSSCRRLYRSDRLKIRSSVVSVLISLMLFPVLHLIQSWQVIHQIEDKDLENLCG